MDSEEKTCYNKFIVFDNETKHKYNLALNRNYLSIEWYVKQSCDWQIDKNE